MVIYKGEKRQTVDMDRNNFIIEMVLKVNKSSGGLVEKMKDEKGYSLYIKDGKINLKLSWDEDNYYRCYTEEKIEDGNWHHLIAEVDRVNKKVKIYLDGKETGLKEEGELLDESLSNNGDFIVGKCKEAGYFKGMVDFLRISRGILKDAETTIDELYKWEFDGPFLRDFLGNKRF
jgi:hypothetical protein